MIDQAKMIANLHNLTLIQGAVGYDLEEPAERRRSVAELERLFFRLLRYAKPALFVEAGAKDAAVSERVRAHAPEARIVAFEANPYSYDLFQRHPRIGSADIEYRHLALCEEPGSIEFKLQTEIDGKPQSKTRGVGSLLCPADDAVALETVTVEATSLDAYFEEERDAKAFVWVDVEGASNSVLSGGRDFFKRAVDVAFVEVEDRELWNGQWLSDEVHAFMAECGFIPVARDFQTRYQYNVLYLHERAMAVDYFRFCLSMYYSQNRRQRS